MKRTIKLCLSSAIGAYIIKFLVDVVMYIFMKNDQNDLYYDFWYLFVPQIVSSFMLIGFYCMFFSKKFYGLFFMISTAVLIISNIVFIVLIYFDSAIGYTFYFALIAAINFLNALYLKCNIIPEKKSGRIEYVPMIFELIPFVCMVISLYSVFCTFPTLEVNEVARAWEYYDLMTGMKLNMVSEVILIFAYFLCRINNAEIIRDNMFDEQIQE